MLKILLKIFRISKPKEVLVKETSPRRNVIEPDFIDYDGMGNQGRFPDSRK